MCSCNKGFIGHQALEILVGVARMPKSYRKIRKDIMKENYTPYLKGYGLEALDVLLGIKQPEEVNPKARACARDIQKIADNDRRFTDASPKN